MTLDAQNAIFQCQLIFSVKLILIGPLYPIIRNSIYLQSSGIQYMSSSPLLAAVVLSSYDPLGPYSYFTVGYTVRIVEFKLGSTERVALCELVGKCYLSQLIVSL